MRTFFYRNDMFSQYATAGRFDPRGWTTEIRPLQRSFVPDLSGLRCSPYSNASRLCIRLYRDRLRGLVARILIADDRELMRIALKTLFVLRPHWEICGEAEDGREAVAKATQLQPDLIVLDFKMPLGDGLQAACEICRTMPATPIVMYTLYKSVELEAAAKLAGVRRIVAKEDGVQGLLHAIEAELVAKKYQREPDQP
jgi:CheY-like chemotaxis protein